MELSIVKTDIVMELLFNELSLNPLCSNRYEAHEKMDKLVMTIKKAIEFGFRKVRFHRQINEIFISDNFSISDWLNGKVIKKDYRDFFYSVQSHPFINELDDEIENKYIEAEYYFEDKINGIEKIKCLGLASAYLYETLSISLSSKYVWNSSKLTITKVKDGLITQECVLNVSSCECFIKDDIKEFIEHIGSLTLIKTSVNPEAKKIHLAQHHGIAELDKMCNKLKNSPYVIEIQSTDWGGKNFIRKITKNGIIEIVLIKTRRQYALSVKSTGRSYRETKAISEKLTEQYS